MSLVTTVVLVLGATLLSAMMLVDALNPPSVPGALDVDMDVK
jgi:hypothetical protein